MNQILIVNNKKNINKKIYFLLFLISISICIFLCTYLLCSFFIRINEYKTTLFLKSKYSINSLYTNNSNIETLKLSNHIYIIGKIEIPKINISYPIIKSTDEELLKLSICRFSGPLPNRIGNLCLAGHNYKNNLMFSNLYKLNIGDSIFITDLNNTKLKYIIYNIFDVEEQNLDCLQNTNNVEITLITCNNNDNSKRTIIKAKVKG